LLLNEEIRTATTSVADIAFSFVPAPVGSAIALYIASNGGSAQIIVPLAFLFCLYPDDRDGHGPKKEDYTS